MDKNTTIKEILLRDSSITTELGQTLYAIILESDYSETHDISEQDCIDYILNLTINEPSSGFHKKSVVNDGLAKIFPDILFEESDAEKSGIELDYVGDVDYIAKVGNKALGIQIKPVTAKANFGNYSASERMKASFMSFEEDYGGKVFVVFSLDGEIANKEVVDEIGKEIERLSK